MTSIHECREILLTVIITDFNSATRITNFLDRVLDTAHYNRK